MKPTGWTIGMLVGGALGLVISSRTTATGAAREIGRYQIVPNPSLTGAWQTDSANGDSCAKRAADESGE